MRIGIDARLWYETGVGRYIRNLVRELSQSDTEHTYIVFLSQDGFDTFTPPNSRWQKRLVPVRWHTLQEQIVLPFVFAREHLDILHIPYFNVPILYPGRYVVTIHDLTILHNRTGRATRLPMWMYDIRRLGYRFILSVALARAEKIFAVSETTKRDILDHYHIDQTKIIVTYEGVEIFSDTILPDRQREIGKKIFSLEQSRFLLSVGNAYPHKNLEALLTAFDALHKDRQYVDVKLVMVGKEDYFTDRLKKRARSCTSHADIVFFGEAREDELRYAYEHASAFVFPSLAEGFGLPAIEARAYGCPVICSDIPIFHEILGATATYFDPKDVTRIVQAIKSVLMQTKKPKAVLDGRFSWKQMAQKTQQSYEDSTRV